jgi:drug/metabolite transporter (DMT)-like permease
MTISRFLVALSTIFHIGSNVAILSILTIYMYDDKDKCLLSKDRTSLSCNYGYAVSGIGCCLCIGIALLYSCNNTVFTKIKILLYCILCAWYSGLGSVITWSAYSANQTLVPQQDWRITIVVLIWCNLGMTLLTATFYDWHYVQKRFEYLDV